MSTLEDVKLKRQINPLISLGFVISISMIIAAVSFLIFWNSNTKNIVQSIQRSNLGALAPEIATGLDDDDHLSPAELLFIQSNLDLEANKLQPETDFGGKELDKSTIGF